MISGKQLGIGLLLISEGRWGIVAALFPVTRGNRKSKLEDDDVEVA